MRWRFFLRLSLHKKILVLNNPLVKYRIHPGQYTKKNYSNVAKEFEITLKSLLMSIQKNKKS